MIIWNLLQEIIHSVNVSLCMYKSIFKYHQYNLRTSIKSWGQPSQFSRITFVEERGLSEFGRNNFLIVPFTEIPSITMWVVCSMGTHLSRPDLWQYLNPCTVIRVYNKFPTMHFSMWSWTNMLGDFKMMHTATLFLRSKISGLVTCTTQRIRYLTYQLQLLFHSI